MLTRFGVRGLSSFAAIVLACVVAGGPTWAGVCGNGTIEPPETCDRGSCVLIDFEGLGKGVSVGTISGPPDATFDPSWLAVTDAGGNFPNTTAAFQGVVPGPIDFDEGVRFVEVFYSATAASLPLTLTAWSGSGGTGVIIGSAEGNTIGTDEGSFRLWDSLQLASAHDEIWSITLTGAVANVLSFDNMTFCTGLPTSPMFCRSNCTYCGDSVLDSAEECDDGNYVDGDGCSAGFRRDAAGRRGPARPRGAERPRRASGPRRRRPSGAPC